jgi:hypothetical protein
MPQSLAKIYIHLVFSTKHRQPWLTDNVVVRGDLHAYPGGTLKGLGCIPVEINSEACKSTAYVRSPGMSG